MKQITEKLAWEALTAHAGASFAQSWEWGEFQRAAGEHVFRFASDAGFCQLIEKGLPFGFKVWFVPRGPVGFLESEYRDLEDEAKRHGAVFLRVEPSEKPMKGKQVTAVSPAVTLLCDLTQSEDALLAAMHQKTRYNIRLAEKKGVTVSESTDVDAWLALHHETTARDRFHGHPDSYYRAMLASPIATLFVASDAGKPLAALIAIFFGDAVTYLHGASSNEAREVMAPHLLHWRVMQIAKAAGYKRYDWWGVNPEDPKNPAYKKSWEGITRFKQGFGGAPVEFPGTFELPVRPPLYLLYSLRRKLLGKK